ncbi:MAG: hypothetical protein DU480_07830 [Nitrosomonas sp.]|uniref:hypothetical protein n=1 Tax=Nitrosomonas sp. TaxID=42353 RepID=UPI0032EE312E
MSLLFLEKEFSKANTLYNILFVYIFAGILIGCDSSFTNITKISEAEVKQENLKKDLIDNTKEVRTNFEEYSTVAHSNSSEKHKIVEEDISPAALTRIDPIVGDSGDFPPVLGGGKK